MASRRILNSIRTKLVKNRRSASRTTTNAPEAIFIEKSSEEPVLVLAEEYYVDIIGPPDSLSNLRPVIRKRLINETALQQKLREMQDNTQEWNQQFWATHNTNFTKERQEYVRKHAAEGQILSADEMSEFYKQFLDENWRAHVNYNLEWYRRNFTLLFLALRVALERSKLKLL